ncbi:coniferyl-aldehyde dehydrogenase [Vibrionales bacterium C3R12]|nr:coniferyl-aldehyde dehydrogenase [Vibrionales bacterium C3R12]
MNAQAQIDNVQVSDGSLEVSSLERHFADLTQAYQGNCYPDKQVRIETLQQLKANVLKSRPALIEALSEDYGFRSSFDSMVCDLMPAIQHINYTIKKLPKWMKPSRRHAGLLLTPSTVSVHYQPLGVVGVIVPWNFPIVLSIAPIVTALAAGNRVMVKLSEFTPSTNQVLRSIFKSFPDQVVLIEGDGAIAAEFSRLPFNHLLFTGSTAVGRLVAKAAAEHLTPITLELGGKSPTIIGEDADLKSAVDAIMFGKSSNAGQICVAPDYVFVPDGKQNEFIEIYKQRFLKAFKEKKGRREITNIINQAQFARLNSYLDDAKNRGATITTIEGELSEARQMWPHFVTDVDDSMLLMQDEIFGPILPIMTYKNVDECITYINSHQRPLALYLMSSDKELQSRVLNSTHSGGVAINDAILQVAADDAPFGGIGESGIGSYHGIEGFHAFSNAKTVLKTPAWLPRSHWMLTQKKLLPKLIKTLFLR